MKAEKNRKSIILIVGEGKNQTERLYFRNFNTRGASYSIKFVPNSGYTDPKGLLNLMRKYYNEYQLDKKLGDRAYIIIDTDCNEEKFYLIKNLQNSEKNIEFITSNPCVEIWFLLHFIYTTKEFKDSKEPKLLLKDYISNYKESLDVYLILRNRQEMAIKNSKRLIQYHKAINATSRLCNPITYIINVVEYLLTKKI